MLRNRIEDGFAQVTLEVDVLHVLTVERPQASQFEVCTRSIQVQVGNQGQMNEKSWRTRKTHKDSGYYGVM